MAETSQIEWTDATWNPVTGCTLVSEGCRNCYAAELAATRLKNHPSREGLARKNADGVAKFTGEIRVNYDWLYQPMGWRKPRQIFVCAHSDLFHEGVPDEVIDKVFAVMALTPHHTYQVLTKRPERMRAYCERRNPNQHHPALDYAALMAATGSWNTPALDLRTWPLPNVWLGVSIEDQVTAETRIPYLLKTPAAVRFLSAEPLLGPVDLATWIGSFPIIPGSSTYLDKEGSYRQDFGGGLLDGLHWIIVGGESGRKARPMHPDWVRSIRDQCEAAGVAFFFKQWGGYLPLGQTLPSLGKIHGGSAVKPGRFRLHYGGSPTEKPKHAFADHGVEFSYTGGGHITFRVGKKASGRLLDGVLHDGMPDLGGAS